ncbi:PTS beta-glucoside transporter subunit IIBC [bacteria symbiont BFo1 of Frankliniella occidentalis]|jgi:PTS system ascorbate-specific IIC component|uniref:Ascorbate-specific PTS system EIIC component n=1 Tax=Erwinia aphidicola TaxID=68334 RepID=A0ABU8DKN5_ERWAP|nr:MULTISPECIES: PTS ascorbate transporter subunit IIC [Erwinia]KMV71293.1 PTS beta-glucoside transporter subunit IIBC [bacteria symbiont BFo1 of Frankliniella occidentalis]PIJ60299.1 PTS ascorbate transporter subunit IIC [Erwinia sp. OLMDLW33]VTT27673.1 integral membrane protein [Klebsiella pneumoniae]KYP85391.1 PTS beta-glucoside transporter subunit IIBC [bacteria symbiont BFo1 of Frankliniella occidentalis]KYP90661.1 PTS beta-glucoside transporter subunit IIBC [bacteria symbiont BFo1 of Fra
MEFFRFLMSDVLSEPSILVGLIALIGLVAQKKPATEVIKGTVKTVMGFLILGAGAGLIVSSLGDFAAIFHHAFGIPGVVPNNEAIVAVAQKSFGTEMAMIMFFAMVINIAIARFTPWKYIFLTGHHTLFMSMMVAVILATAGMKGATLIAVGSLVVGVSMVFFPAIIHPYMKKVTGSDDVAFGHFSAISQLLSAWIGSKFGNKEKSTEDMEVPKSLLFLRDTPVAIAFTMFFIFIFTCLVAGPSTVKEMNAGGKNWFMFSLMQSITFAAGVYIVLQGVRMVIAEIVPAFKGISDKLVPNAKPALDCPVVFPYAPNAVLVGFLSSFVAGVLGMFLLYALNMTVIIPGVVPHFFVGAAAGVFGNATGGRRGAILGAFTNGLLITFIPVFLLPVLGSIGLANTTFSDSDFGAVGILLGLIVR